KSQSQKHTHSLTHSLTLTLTLSLFLSHSLSSSASSPLHPGGLTWLFPSVGGTPLQREGNAPPTPVPAPGYLGMQGEFWDFGTYTRAEHSAQHVAHAYTYIHRHTHTTTHRHNH